jgi:hypothetical protein
LLDRLVARGSDSGIDPRRRTLALYLAAGGAYVALGVFFPAFLFSWVVGAGFLLLCVWLLPALVRRLRR